MEAAAPRVRCLVFFKTRNLAGSWLRSCNPQFASASFALSLEGLIGICGLGGVRF